MKQIKKGDVVKWRGIRNRDTGKIDFGYLYIATVDGGTSRTGYPIKASTRAEAIKKYLSRNNEN